MQKKYCKVRLQGPVLATDRSMTWSDLSSTLPVTQLPFCLSAKLHRKKYSLVALHYDDTEKVYERPPSQPGNFQATHSS